MSGTATARLAGMPLSTPELEVLRRVADGLDNRAVGKQLGVSLDTVKTHIRRVLAKLGAHDRAHAVSLAYRGGLLKPEPGDRPLPPPPVPQRFPVARPVVVPSTVLAELLQVAAAVAQGRAGVQVQRQASHALVVARQTGVRVPLPPVPGSGRAA